jgi:hypothetical protein
MDILAQKLENIGEEDDVGKVIMWNSSLLQSLKVCSGKEAINVSVGIFKIYF